MNEPPNDMDPTKLMDEIRSLHLKLDSVTKTLISLDKKVNELTESQQSGSETVHKSSDSVNIIIRFLTSLRKLSPTALKNTLIEADDILNTANPGPKNQTKKGKEKLKTLLNEVFESLPFDTSVDANSCVASTSNGSRRKNIKVEEEKIQFWRRYKNKYNYIERLKLKLPPLKDSVEEQESLQNDGNGNTQNDRNDSTQNDGNENTQNDGNDNTQNDGNDNTQNDGNDNTQNDGNDNTQNDGNEITQNDGNDNTQNDGNEITQNDVNDDTKYTLNDVIHNLDVYKMFKSKLKNSPYDDPYFKNNASNNKLTLTLQNGETIVRPVSHVAPLIILKKCDDLCPIPLQNKKPTGKYFQSTSRMGSNRNNTTVKITKRETRSNKTRNITNGFKTNDKASVKKRSLSIKNRKQEPSKKKKKSKQSNIH